MSVGNQLATEPSPPTVPSIRGDFACVPHLLRLKKYLVFYMRPPDSKSPSLASVRRRFQARQTSRTPESREGPNLARVVVSHIGGRVLWYYVNFWTDWFRHLSPSSPMVISEIQKIQNRFVRGLVPAEDSSVRSRARLQMPLARVLSLLPSFGHGRGGEGVAVPTSHTRKTHGRVQDRRRDMVQGPERRGQSGG